MSSAAKLSPAPAIADAVAAPVVPAAEFNSRMATIGRHSSVFFSGTLLTTAAGYFFRVYLARTLGPEQLGLYTMGMSITGFLCLFGAFGLPTAASRFVAEYSAKHDYARLGSFFKWALGLLASANLVLAAVVVIAGPWIGLHFYHTTALDKYFWLFALIMFCGSLSAFLGQAMAGYQDVSRRTLITHFLGTPANMLMTVALITLGFGLSGYLASQVACGFLVLSLLAFYCWKLTPPAVRLNVQSRAEMPRGVVAFCSAALVMASVQYLLGQTDSVILGYYLDAKQVGIYAVATALVGFVPVALQSVNQIFSPTIAELYATGNHAVLQQLYSTLTKWVLALTVPLALTIIFFSRPLLAIFGVAFEVGATALIIGTLGQLINCAAGSVGYLLLMSGHEGQLVRIQAVSAFLMIVFGVALVPRFGMKGAALSDAVAVSVTNLWALRVVYRKLGLFPYNVSFLRLSIPSCVAALTLLLVRSEWRTQSVWLLAAIAFTCGYIVFMVSFALFGMDDKDRTLLRSAWSKIVSRSQTLEPA